MITRKSVGSDFIYWLVIVATLVLITGGLSVKLFGFTMTLERLFVIPLCFCLVVWGLIRQKIRLSMNGLILVLWLIWALFVSIICKSAIVSIKGWTILASAMVFYFFAFQSSIERIISFGKIIRPIFMLMSIGAITIFTLYLFTGSVTGLGKLFLETGAETRVRMTMFEPNLFGAIMIIACILSIANFQATSKTSIAYIVISHIALFISFSRAPWLGYLTGLAIYLYLLRRLSFRQLIKSGIIILVLILLLSTITDKLSGVSVQTLTREHSIRSRFIMFALAWQDIRAHPFVGNGVFSFASLHPYSIDLVGSESERSNWIGFMLYAVLHDTGLIGLSIFMCFFVLLFYRCGCTLLTRRNFLINQPQTKYLAAWYGIAVGLLISGQATSTYSLGFFWVILGFIDAISFETPSLSHS